MNEPNTDNTPEPGDNPTPPQPLVPRPPSTIGGAHAAALPFSGEQVKATLTAANATPEQVDHLVWFLIHGRDQKVGGLTKLGDLIKRDGATLSKIYRGVYPADIAPVVSDIAHYRRLWEERLTFGGEEPFVDTRLFAELSQFCDLARVSQTIGLIWGPNQSGKTRGLQVYAQRNNHGRTIYVRMPAGGTGRRTLNAIARACGISERHSYEALTEKIIRFFGPDVLLIVDEAHQAIVGGKAVKAATLELIREIHDVAGCGVVLCGTDALPDALRDPAMAKFLAQFDNRGVLRRRVPAVPYPEDVAAILARYGLPVPEEQTDEARLLAKVLKDSGVGKLTKYLRMARRLSAKRAESFAWRHVLSTHATLQSWANGEEGR